MNDVKPDQQERMMRQIYREEKNAQLRWDSFYPDAVAQVKECLEKDGDLMDLINELDLNYDEYDNLENSEINDIVINAVKQIMEVM